MKKNNKKNLKTFKNLIIVFICFFSLMLQSSPVSKEQVTLAVQNWLKLSRGKALNTTFLTKNIKIKPFKDKKGKTLFFISELQEGFIILSSDDLIEPIIAFSSKGHFKESLDNPLFVLLINDMQDRLQRAGKINQAKIQPKTIKPLIKVEKKWQELTKNHIGLYTSGITIIDDIYVEPLIQTKWGQETTNIGLACYNYYTPTKYGVWESGNPNNYPSGCVATAMAQLLKYYSYPLEKVGTKTYDIMVDGYLTTADLRGGDGKGGPYQWSYMTLNPNSGSTEAQRQAIGNLMHDCGLSVKMQYNYNWSGAATTLAAKAFKETFLYTNAKRAYDSGIYILPEFHKMINPNLDAKCPVILGITGDGGHAIVSDGYGYNYSTMYHHLVLGWDGSDDAWYALPDIKTSYADFDTVYKCIYNVFPEEKGEIISGRVTDLNGVPLENITIIASNADETFKTKSNIHGIYFFKAIPSNTEYTINCGGQVSETIKTGNSTYSGDGSYTVGNCWGVNFSIDKTNNIYKVIFKTNNIDGAYLEGATTQTIAFGDNTSMVKAIAPNNGNFIKWESDTNQAYFDNPLIIENVMSDMTITAIFSIKAYTIGSAIPIYAKEVISLKDQEFTFLSKAFASTPSGGYYPLRSMKLSLPSHQAQFLWIKKMPIYNKKELKVSSYSDYIANNGHLSSVQVQLSLKTKVSKDYRINSYIKTITIVPPVITELLGPNEENIYSVLGNYFGNPSPKLLLEDKNSGKHYKLKDLKIYNYKDSKGEDSVMDYITGASSLQFKLPPSIPSGVYYLILDNNIGFALGINKQLIQITVP